MKIYHVERNLDIKLEKQIADIKERFANVVYTSSDGKTITFMAD